MFTFGEPASGNLGVTAGAKGFVHVHNGIHGSGDLSADSLDCCNPVARVVLERVK